MTVAADPVDAVPAADLLAAQPPVLERVGAIATPFNDRVIELVHAMERGERSPAPEELTELVAVAGP